MKEHRGSWRGRWLPALALAAALGSEGGFDVAGGSASIGREAWMPDVGPRIADLKARANEAAAEAKSRRTTRKNDGQWWRAVAARPGAGERR
ncbi:MAG: hypothetical protein ABR538_02715 [Candidatus Binatia bacterium]